MIGSPYLSDGEWEWLRGNPHTHTAASPDADRPVADVVADYEARGYDFLAVTDHDVLVDLADVRDDTAMTLVPGVEVTDGGPHLLWLGGEATVAPDPDPDRQAVLDAATGAGAVAVLAHPNWGPEYEHYPQSTLRDLTGYAGIEVFNGAIRRGKGNPDATDRWDRLLADGRVVWGYAADDSHRPEEVATGWTVVQVRERTPEAVLAALRAGRCYASTGVEIRDVTVTAAGDGARDTVTEPARGATVTVETADADAVRLVADYDAVQHTVAGPTAAFTLPGDLRAGHDCTYVRLECLGSAGTTAWTQPLFLDGRTVG